MESSIYRVFQNNLRTAHESVEQAEANKKVPYRFAIFAIITEISTKKYCE